VNKGYNKDSNVQIFERWENPNVRNPNRRKIQRSKFKKFKIPTVAKFSIRFSLFDIRFRITSGGGDEKEVG